MKTVRDRGGFTIVEVLVVMAIIGILSVMAVPLLFDKVDMAKVAKLESDFNAVKTAAILYEADNGKLPSWDKIKENSMDFLEYIDGINEKSPIGGDYSLHKRVYGSDGVWENLHTYDGENFRSIDGDIVNYGRLFLAITDNEDDMKISIKQLNKLVRDLGSDNVYLSFYGGTFESGLIKVFIKLL